MRITLISPFDPTPDPSSGGDAHVGGVERVFSHLSHELSQRGHDVRILCSTDGTGGNGRDNGVEFVRVRRSGTIFRAPLVNLSNRIEPDADIVHVAATYPFTTPSVLRTSDKLGIPCVMDFHFEPRPGSTLGRLAAGLYRRLATRTYRRADRVLVNSLEYARTVSSLEHVPETRWRELPNGIDPARFHPNGDATPGEYMLFVGRLVPYKGIEVLLRSLEGAQGKLPPLRIAGDGPCRAELEALADELDVDVEFLGYVPGEDLPALYRGARLTVLPSVNQQEAFGICLLESMACGTPVVASALPGVRQVAHQGGLLARPGDQDDLRERLLEALRSEEIPRGEELAETIHDRYAWGAVTDRLLEIYDEILEPPSRSVREGSACASSP